jgi:hypothetical protein
MIENQNPSNSTSSNEEVFNKDRQDFIADDYNPLDEAVNEKVYSQPNFRASAEDLSKPIGAPQYTPPPLGRENPYKDISKDNSGAAEQQPVNPALNDVSDKEKHIAAVHLTNVILDSYEQLHVFANMALPISKKKVNKLVAEGELDLSIQVPYDAGKHMSAGELIETYNEQVKDALTVSEEFKETVRPPLIRVLEKKRCRNERWSVYHLCFW